jgi:hypothetical protein
MGRSLVALIAGVTLGALLNAAERFLLWPRLLAPGGLDLNNPNVRLLFFMAGAIPPFAAGLLTARVAPDRRMVLGTLAGACLLAPMLIELPRVLEAYAKTPQSTIPLYAAMALRPLAGAAGASLSLRLTRSRSLPEGKGS